MKKMWKKAIAMLLVVIMIGGAAPLGALAEMDWLTVRASAESYSGSCGDNLLWNYDTTARELTITGTGMMYDYTYSYSNGSCIPNTPWMSFRHSILTVSIGNGVTRIGNWAFSDCSALKNVSIPDSVVIIGDYAFYSCTSILNVTIPSSVLNIGDSAFNYCTSLSSVTIPDTVTSIGENVFFCCSNLAELSIGSGITNISGWAFAGCTSLASIDIPSSVTNISDFAFSDCSNLDNLIIPDNVICIGESAFNGCSSLSDISIYDSITSMGGYAFDDTAFYGNEENWSDDMLYVGHYLVAGGNGSAKKCEILPNTRCIAAHAFSDYIYLTSIIIPDSVISIGDFAFYNCRRLTQISIPQSVNYIGEYAFSSCDSLTSVTIPNSITSIGLGVFSYCPHLSTVCYDGNQLSELSIGSDNESLLNATWFFHKHNKKTKTEIRNAIAPTCSTKGYSGDICYSPCGVIIQSGDTLAINPAAHRYDAVVTAPTATEGGFTTFTCSECGKRVVTRETSQLSVPVYTLTLIGNGGTVQQLAELSMTYSAGSTIQTPTAIRDGYTFIEWLPTLPTVMPERDLTAFAIWKPMHSHETTILNQVIPTCDTEGHTGVVYCETCNEIIDFGSIIPTLGHAWDNGIITTEATCTENGIREYTCKVCNTTKEEPVAAWGHSFDDGSVTQQPDCIAEGEKTFVCAACGQSYTEPIPANGHSYTFAIETLPTCTTDGEMRYTCSVCGDTYLSPIKASHNYNAVRTEPTCTEPGAITYICTACGDSYTDTVLEALGHKYNQTVIPATCTTSGYTQNTCERCGDTYASDETEMIPHTYGDWGWDTEPTIDTDGLLVKTCTVCGNQIERPVEKTYLRFEIFKNEEADGREEACVVGLQNDFPAKITIPVELAGFPVTKLDKYTFLEHDGANITSSNLDITEVEILAELSAIPEYTFWKCSNLTSVLLPETLNVIGVCAFGYCEKLQHLSLPHNLRRIETHAFVESGLRTLHIPASMENAEGAFVDCPDMLSFSVDPSSSYYSVIDGVLFDKDCWHLLAYPLGRDDTTYLVPDGVQIIDYGAFGFIEKDSSGNYPTSPLRTVVLPDSLVHIKDCAFQGQSSLAEMDIPSGVLMISVYAFRNCSSLKRVSIPESVVFIGTEAFHGCSALQSVCYSGTVGRWNRIRIDENNDELTSARRYYHSHTEEFATIIGRINPTCTTEGFTGSYMFACGYDLGPGEAIPALGHAYQAEVIAPTCEANGYTRHTCSRCGDIFVTDETASIGHAWDAGKVTQSPTCTEAGIRTFTCQNDSSHTRTESIPATGHSFGAWSQTKAPTVYEDGEKTQTCYKCGAKNTQSIPKLSMPTVAIRNFTTSTKAYDYRSTITFRADVENPITGGQIHWFVDGKDVYTGDVYTVKEAKASFEIQVKYIDGSNILSQTEIEKVNVNTGFFAKLKAFFRGLFGNLPKVVQEYLGIEIIDRIIPD